MPIYAYECTKCGQAAEYIQKFSDPPMETCEQCGGPLRRQVTSAAFHLKGGGWYKDLYASSKPDKAGGEAGAKSSDDKSSGDKSSGGSEGGSSSGSSSSGPSSPASGGSEGSSKPSSSEGSKAAAT